MRFYSITAGLLFCLFLFLACGEGTISGADVSDDLALLNYGQFNPEGMTSLVNSAIADCQADEKCKSVMDKMEGKLDSIAALSSSSSETTDTEESSASRKPIIASSTTAPIISRIETSSSSEPTVTETSSESQVVNGYDYSDYQFIGTCKVSSPSIEKGSTGSFVFSKESISKESNESLMGFLDRQKAYNAAFSAASCVWIVDKEESTQECGTGLFSSTFAKSGDHTVSVKIKNKTFDCGIQHVNGAPITGCTCTPDVEKPDVAGGPVTVTWTVSSCVTDATIVGYSWTDATGSSTTATAVFSEKNVEVVPEVTVSNDDNAEKTFTCSAVKSINSDSPDYEITALNSKVMVPSGSCVTVSVSNNHVRVEHPWQFEDCTITLTYNGTSQSTSPAYCNLSNGLPTAVAVGGQVCIDVETENPDGGYAYVVANNW